MHDRFLLPTFVRMDFDDVIADLQRAGFAFDREWFAPHFEFRFPRIGEVKVQGIEVAVRSALEPWNVLGEENNAGSTARFVDASLERLEVKATGLNGNRHAITVNGRALPLQPTGRDRRVRLRRALPRLAAAVGAASDDRCARAVDVRRRRSLERTLARWLPLSRRAPRRAQRGDAASQRV